MATARQNRQCKETALKKFRQANLMLPNPIRKFFWEDLIYGGSSDKKKKNRVRTVNANQRR